MKLALPILLLGLLAVSAKAVALDGDGNLAISTLKDGDWYLDACVRTRGKFEHAHGYYVARIKLQNQPGHWSA